MVREVETNKIFNHVDRNLGNPDLAREIHKKIAEAFGVSFAEKP